MTKTFLDSKGRTWAIHVTGLTVDDVESDPGTRGVNLIGVLDPTSEWSGKFSANDAFALRVLWSCLKRQAESAKIVRDDFLFSLGGDQLLAGREALTDAVIDFLSQPQRDTLSKMMARSLEGIDQTREKIVEAQGRLRPKTCGEKSGSLQAGSA